MNNLEETELDEIYTEEELRIEGQDLRLIKALVSDEDIAREFVGTYDYRLFIGDSRHFARKVIQYIKTYGTIPTRRVMLEQADVTDKEEIEAIWNYIENTDFIKSEFKYDLDKIKDRYSDVKIRSVKEAIDNLGYESVDYDDIIRNIKSTLDDAEKIRKGHERVYYQKTLKEYIPEFRDDFVAKSKNENVQRGIMTNYSFLDYVTNGISPSDMWIIGGETGSGKSMLLANLAAQIWIQSNNINSQKQGFGRGYNVQYFSLEMPYEQCARRTLARLAEIPTYALRDANVPDHKLMDLSNVANFIDNYPFNFEIVDIPRGVTVSQIEERFLEAVSRGRRPDVVIVDYLGLMEDPGAQGDDWLKLGFIAGRLHEFARAHNVAVITAVQLNRPKGKDPGDVIGLHRIGRSSLIMHHATVGIQIETRPNEEQFTDMIYHIIKNRNGERGHHSLMKNFKCAILTDLESYQPQTEEVGSFSSVNVFTEDISDKLARFGWL